MSHVDEDLRSLIAELARTAEVVRFEGQGLGLAESTPAERSSLAAQLLLISRLDRLLAKVEGK